MSFISDALGSLTGGGGGDLSVQMPDLSEEGKGLIRSQIDRGRNPDKTNIGQNIQGTYDKFSPMNASNASLSQAFKSRMNQAYNQGTEKMRANEGLADFEKGAGARQTAFNSAMAWEKVNTRNRQMMEQVQLANDQARAASLRSILGLVGTGMGMAIGNARPDPSAPSGGGGGGGLSMPSMNYGAELNRKFGE